MCSGDRRSICLHLIKYRLSLSSTFTNVSVLGTLKIQHQGMTLFCKYMFVKVFFLITLNIKYKCTSLQ